MAEVIIGQAVVWLELEDKDDKRRIYAAFTRVADTLRDCNWEKWPVEEGICVQCEVVFDCFDAVCGKGTAARVFGGSCRLSDAVAAFEQLAEAVRKQQDALEDRRAEAMTHYAVERCAGPGDDRL